MNKQIYQEEFHCGPPTEHFLSDEGNYAVFKTSPAEQQTNSHSIQSIRDDELIVTDTEILP